MSRIDVIMPQMGESIAEGTLSKWLKKVGDEVKRDEPIFEISTDKVDAEIPAPSAGVLAEILVQEGQTVPVQTVVARLETEKGAMVGAGAPAPAASGARGGPPALESTSAPAEPHHPSTATPSTPSHAGNGGGASGGNSLEDRLRTKSSPLVRKIAAEHGIELTGMRGSGIAGRVTKKDILEFIDGGGASRPAMPSAPRTTTAAPLGAMWPTPTPEPGDVVEPMTKMRTVISDHMALSRRTAAHVTSFMEIDFTRIARLRAARRAAFEASTGQKLTYLPFIIKAVIDGIKAFPVMNASVAGDSIIYRKQVNIGVAVALDWGLIVPVIKHADDLSLTGITRTLNDLAGRARAKKLSPEEVQGGTFTITNPGVFGSLMGTPIINQPQVAILGVGTIEKRPKVMTGPDGEDVIAIRTCAYFSISFDHRIIDGAVADQYLAHVKKTLETYPDAGF
ncbi:MAG: dihydrolipoamide acetyltransferase family protein [Gemmatimonadaceae bacterium]